MQLLGRRLDPEGLRSERDKHSALRLVPRPNGRNCAQFNSFSVHANPRAGECQRDELYPQGCRRGGECLLLNGTCGATAGQECRKSQECRASGNCGLVAGECVPTSQVDCQQSTACRVFGMCRFYVDQCVAMREEDCRMSTGRRKYSNCLLRRGYCFSSGAAACRQSEGCRKEGRCSLNVDGVCDEGTDEDCRRSTDCSEKGLCRWDGHTCSALQDTDCAAAQACLKEKRCTARDGQCVYIPREQDPPPPTPACSPARPESP